MAAGRFTVFCKKRSIELIGAGLLALGLFLLISFISFDPFDPSLDLAIEDAKNSDIHNWGGEAGAWFSVPAIKLLGFSSFVLSLIVIAWGYKVMTKSFYPSKIWIRVTAFLISVPILCALFACLDRFVIMPEIWPTVSSGGYIGQYVFGKLSPILTYPGFVVASLILSVISIYFASGLTKREWSHMGAMVAKLASALASFVMLLSYQARKLLANWRSGGELEQPARAYTPPKPRKKVAPKPQAPSIDRPLKSQSRSIRKREKNEDVQESMELGAYTSDDVELPPISLLQAKRSQKNVLSESALQQNAEMLEKVLEDFGVQGKIIEVRPGPVVTQYALEPAAGTKSSRVIGLADDIARSMSSVSARIAVIPGQNAIGIELPNSKRQTVYLREMIEDKSFKNNKHKLPLALGKDIGGEPITIDLARTPHMLVAGTTGSGKSVAVNAMILSLLYRYGPSECKFIMVDPKMLELSMYQDIPHLLTPVVTEPGKAVVALKWTVKEMENRYRLMSNLGVRNMEGYNKKLAESRNKGEVLKRNVQTGFDPQTGKPTFEKVDMDMTPMPFIVVIVDEMADLMLVAGKEIEISIQRLAQMARAAGIHIILATQRPSVDVITGIIKANFPTRVSFQVTSKIDSRTILGEQGAEQLLGMGDMLYMAGGSRITRVHGPFVDDKEVERVVEFVKSQGSPEYIEEVTTDSDDGVDLFGDNGNDDGKDDLYHKAVAIVQDTGKASTSFIQRQLRIGYNRAANIVDELEKDGIISQADHVGRREVLVK